MKKFLISLIIAVWATGAFAYTYDGKHDPATFFTYEPLFVEPLSQVTALMVVGKEMADPRYVVVCVMRVPGGLIILAYAYYEDGNLKHYMMNQETKCYEEHPFDPAVPGEAELEKKLRKLLDTFHGYSDC
jgi:hypothetical protein